MPQKKVRILIRKDLIPAFRKVMIRLKNLNDLLAKDAKAKQFFLTLPENAQGALIQSTNQIHNMDELYLHACQAMESYACQAMESHPHSNMKKRQ